MFIDITQKKVWDNKIIFYGQMLPFFFHFVDDFDEVESILFLSLDVGHVGRISQENTLKIYANYIYSAEKLGHTKMPEPKMVVAKLLTFALFLYKYMYDDLEHKFIEVLSNRLLFPIYFLDCFYCKISHS